LFVFKYFHGLLFEGNYLTTPAAPYIIKRRQEITNRRNSRLFTDKYSTQFTDCTQRL